MDFWEAKAAERRLREFKDTAERYWATRPSRRVDPLLGTPRGPQQDNEASSTLREKLSLWLPEVRDMSMRLGCARVLTHYPPPMIGGPVLHVDMLDLVINQDIGNYMSQASLSEIRDALNQHIGAATTAKNRAWARLTRPWYWPLALVSWVIRIPFIILRGAGLPAKVEENVISQVVKVVMLLAGLGLLALLGLNATDTLKLYR